MIITKEKICLLSACLQLYMNYSSLALRIPFSQLKLIREGPGSAAHFA